MNESYSESPVTGPKPLIKPQLMFVAHIVLDKFHLKLWVCKF